MNMTPFTRRLEACRRRWNKRSLRYVLAIARIIRAARRAAKSERRWCRWIREETRMSRITVHRYLRVAEFIKSNVPLVKQIESLSIVKVYALSRLRTGLARSLIRNGKAERMAEVELRKMLSERHPRAFSRPTLPNLTKSLDAAVNYLDRTINRWRLSHLRMPDLMQSKLRSKLQSLIRILERVGTASAAAM